MSKCLLHCDKREKRTVALKFDNIIYTKHYFPKATWTIMSR